VAILIGPPGAGKTTVGELLAARLAVSFTDTDAVVEVSAGKPVSDIFIEDGEPAFRELERAAVAHALASSDGVIAVGGGAVLDPSTQGLLAGQPVVYLETGFAAAASRVGLGQARPLLIGNPRATLKALLDQRLPVYQRLAFVTVGTDERTPEQVAAEIAAALATQA
jgi:shikimate kinase